MSIGKQAKVITFIHTRDREKSKAFYRDVLGFSITADDPFGTVVDLNGIALRITPIENHTPNPHTVLGWQVQDYNPMGAAGNAAVATAAKGQAVIDAAGRQLALLLQEVAALPLSTLNDTPHIP